MAVLAVVLFAASSWNGITVVVVVDLIMFVTLVVEHRRIER